MVAKKNSISKSAAEIDPALALLATPPKKYEYERIYDLSMADFNKRGAEGWRLVSDSNRWSMWEREII